MALGEGTLQGGEGTGVNDPFLRALSFSVGVLTTVGTGNIYVVGPTAHWLFVLESLLGPLCLLAAGGLIIARITRPRMRLRFSESAIVAPYEGGRGLMFRIVNARPGELSDVQVRVNLALFEEIDGKRERNFHQLTLERNSVEFFTLHWTVVHPITADSPLRGFTPERLREAEAEFLVLVNAHEETFSTRVTRVGRTWGRSAVGCEVGECVCERARWCLGHRRDRLDRTERLDEGATSKPAALES